MLTKVIRLKDGTEIEVEVDESQVYEISDADVVDSSIDRMKSLLLKVIEPVNDTFQELSNDIIIETTKVTIGVKVGVEGNFFLAKSSAGANIQVEMTLRLNDE